LFIEAHLTKKLKIRSQAKMQNCNIYPSYHAIKAAKEECYPSKDKILIQESLVESASPNGQNSFKHYYG
jgi:hypothetical protein